jgi:hypothetical protein
VQSCVVTEMLRRFRCEQGSGLGSIGFRVLFILLGFSLRDFAAHSDGTSPADVGVLFLFVHSGLYSHVYYIIIVLFILGFSLFLFT